MGGADRPAEESSAAKVALISRELAMRLYGGALPPDASVRLYDLRFDIVGIFGESVGTAAVVRRSDALIMKARAHWFETEQQA